MIQTDDARMSDEKIGNPIDRTELTDGERVGLKLLTIIDPGDRTSNFIDLAETTAIPLRALIPALASTFISD